MTYVFVDFEDGLNIQPTLAFNLAACFQALHLFDEQLSD
jgi:hypothetical protein